MDEARDANGEESPPGESGSTADLAELDGEAMFRVIDSIPGAWARVERGIADAREGRVISLEDM